MLRSALVLVCLASATACGDNIGDADCPFGFTACGGACVNTDIDLDNCGGCGILCDPGEICDGRACTLSCQTGLTDCGGTCVDTTTDRTHCGGCAGAGGASCGDGFVCDGAGACALSCQTGLTDCGGTCVDTTTDRTHCGGCAGAGGASCGFSEVCDTGACAPDLAASCRELLLVYPLLASGTYAIDPDGAGVAPPLDVHCDMGSDGGVGYTMVRFDDAGLAVDQNDYRAFCAARGLEVIVPRTRAHAEAIRAFNGDTTPNLVNVFPRFNGATGLADWTGRCRGEDCTFWLSNSDNANCLGLEPNGDNNVNDALFLNADGVCDYGAWNDFNNFVAIQGHVICSTNDAGPLPSPSCAAALAQSSVHNASADGITGSYTLRTGGTEHDAFCDMVADGGGWTLAMKADGSLGTFAFDQTLWTDTSTLNESSLDLTLEEAKFPAYSLVTHDALRLVVRTTGVDRVLSVPTDAGIPLRDRIDAGFVTTAVGRAAWLTLFGNDIQANCDREGTSVDFLPPHARVRIGIVGNEQASCVTPDSYAGIGGAVGPGSLCYPGGFVGAAVGVASGGTCAAPTGSSNTASFAWVFVR